MSEQQCPICGGEMNKNNYGNGDFDWTCSVCWLERVSPEIVKLLEQLMAANKSLGDQLPRNEYRPDYVTCPGETLNETLNGMKMSPAELANLMELPLRTIEHIIIGRAPISWEIALRLQRVLNIPASFWLRRERAYQNYLRREGKV